jgi:hypothetical protein
VQPFVRIYFRVTLGSINRATPAAFVLRLLFIDAEAILAVALALVAQSHRLYERRLPCDWTVDLGRGWIGGELDGYARRERAESISRGSSLETPRANGEHRLAPKRKTEAVD